MRETTLLRSRAAVRTWGRGADAGSKAGSGSQWRVWSRHPAAPSRCALLVAAGGPEAMACGPLSTVGQCFSYAAAALYILSMLISLIARVSSAPPSLHVKVSSVSPLSAPDACARR